MEKNKTKQKPKIILSHSNSLSQIRLVLEKELNVSNVHSLEEKEYRA